MKDNVITFKKKPAPVENKSSTDEEQQFGYMYQHGPFMITNIIGVGIFATLTQGIPNEKE